MSTDIVRNAEEIQQNGKGPSFTPEEARAKIEADKQRRVVLVSDGIKALLEENKCRLDVFVVLRQGSIEPNINILAND